MNKVSEELEKSKDDRAKTLQLVEEQKNLNKQLQDKLTAAKSKKKGGGIFSAILGTIGNLILPVAGGLVGQGLGQLLDEL